MYKRLSHPNQLFHLPSFWVVMGTFTNAPPDHRLVSSILTGFCNGFTEKIAHKVLESHPKVHHTPITKGKCETTPQLPVTQCLRISNSLLIRVSQSHRHYFPCSQSFRVQNPSRSRLHVLKACKLHKQPTTTPSHRPCTTMKYQHR